MPTPSAIVDQVLENAALHPRKVALKELPGRSITYDQLACEIDSAAAGLDRAGMTQNDAVLFTVPPSIASVTLILALMRIGATIVAADPRMGTRVFASRVALAGPSWVIAESRLFAAAGIAPVRAALRWRGLELPNIATAASSRVRVGRWLPGAAGALSFDHLRRGANKLAERPQPAPDDPALVIFTSGTTASPKGVVHTNASIAGATDMVLEHLDLDADDVVFSTELYLNIPALLRGASSILTRHRTFVATRWIDDVDSAGATVAFAVPSEMLQVSEISVRAGTMLPARLRKVMFGSAPVYKSFLERFRHVVRPATEAWSIYAMSEMLPVCAIEMREKLDASGTGDLVGRPFPGVQLRVVDDHELMVRGPNLFYGYLGGETVREHATGDLAMLDDLGRVWLLGRKKDMIIRGHDNIYPALVESVVESIPGVRRSCLCGWYDEDRADERVVLVVEPDPAADARAVAERVNREIRVGEHRIDAITLPDKIVTMTLPLSPRSQKVERRAVVEQLQEMSI